MRLFDYLVPLKSRSHRVELYPFYDCHIGKRNCYEAGIRKQVREILRQEAKKDRTCRVLFGGDVIDAIKPQDIRFTFNSLADWVYEGKAMKVRDKLNNIVGSQVERFEKLFSPIKHLAIGGLEGNHETTITKRYNSDVQSEIVKSLNMEDLTDECLIRFQFKMEPNTRMVFLYMRHGYGGGRSPGAEPTKIDKMMADGVAANCDICLTGHSHTFNVNPPLPFLYVPSKGKLPPESLVRYRYGANPGSWLLSHQVGKGSYESAACYPTKPMMGLKIVIWPFWHTTHKGCDVSRPKIEMRQYTLL